MLMRVLVISPVCPVPVDSGNKKYLDGILKILLQGGNEISLLVLNSKDRVRAADLEQKIRSKYPSLYKVNVATHPKISKSRRLRCEYNIRKFFDTKQISNEETCPTSFVRRVQKIINNYDIVISFYISLARCIPKNYKGKKIVITNDIQTNIIKSAQKIGLRKEVNVRKYQKEEISLLNEFNVILSINRNESNWFKKVCPSSNIELLYPQIDVTKLSENQEKKEFDLLFVGSPSPFNVRGINWFIQQVFPALLKEDKNLKLAVAGGVSKTKSIQKLTEKYPTNIDLLGIVDDIDSLYKRTRIVLSPIFQGAGTKIKVFEAMGQGKVVVGSKFTFDGMGITDNKNVIIAKDAEEYVEKILNLLKNENLLKRIEKDAVNYIRVVNKNNESVINKLIPSQTKSNLKKSFTRIRALIFTCDAQKIVGYNLQFANELKRNGVYVEFLKQYSGNAGQINSQGYLTHSLQNELDKNLRRRLLLQNDLYTVNSEGILKVAEFQGWDLSREINIYKSMFPNSFENEEKTKHAVANCLVWLDALLKKIKKIKPDFLVGWNGNGSTFNFLIKVAGQILKIPVIHLERGLVPDSLSVSTTGVNFEAPIAGSYLPMISKSEQNKALDFIDRYKRDKRTVVNDEKNESLGDVVLQELGLAEKGYLFFPMQIETDSNIILNSLKYKKMESVLRMLETVSYRSGIKILCRPHPESKTRNFQNYPGLVFDNSMRLHDCIQKSLATVVINSTVGLESILLGIPTITLGNSIYSTKGITYEARSSEDVISALQDISQGKTANENSVERLVVLLFKDYQLNLKADTSERDRFIKDLLTKLGWGNYSAKEYLLPKLGKKHSDLYQSFLKAIKDSIEPINLVVKGIEGEQIWFDGVNRFEASSSTMKLLFEQKFKKQVQIVDNVETNKSITLIAVTGEAKISKDFFSNVLYVDKYFYPIEITETLN